MDIHQTVYLPVVTAVLMRSGLKGKHVSNSIGIVDE